ncbi:winged helix-turn-helix transcriptional regulator [Halobium palmae]|uniref:Winged helix-turn-helix transcriptional regulator n=1 Tax=Halobium palmae TaxID=1776492 RepID=A0ABD5RUK1_9EURY
MIQKENLEEEIRDYPSGKGAIELLCEIGRDGSRYTDLLGELDITSDTLTERLNEAQAALLVEVRAGGHGPGKTVNEYNLRPRGEKVRLHLMNTGTYSSYELYRETRKKFEEDREGAREWMVENSDVLAEGGSPPTEEPE